MKDLFEFYLSDSEQNFTGWDFSYVTDTGRMVESPLKWCYTSKILPVLRSAGSLLDMGTGGGEFLSLLHPLPADSHATEGYEPNLPLARDRLEPLGVKVTEVGKDNRLAFADSYFDLVINRHEEYRGDEVKRVLKKGGYFITQQVGGRNCLELNHLLGYERGFEMDDWDLGYAISELEAEGLNIIEKQEHFPILRFFDVGAIIFYLKAVPWQIPDFSINKYYDALRKVHQRIQSDRYLDIKEHRFLIIAKKD